MSNLMPSCKKCEFECKLIDEYFGVSGVEKLRQVRIKNPECPLKDVVTAIIEGEELKGNQNKED